MLNRQKTLLFLLQAASRPVSKLELTKWAFVMRKETDSQGGSAFYDFLPYKYGPFSFCLYREVDSLIQNGYVAGEKEWEATALAAGIVDSLPSAVKRDARNIVGRLASQQLGSVIEYVYSHYPSYTVNSEHKRLETRPTTVPAVYTAGYEGLSVDAFLDRLIGNGIRRIIDVRNNPVARRYGFHRSTLQRLAARVEIDYVHVPELGIVSALRRELNTQQDYEALFEAYERDTLSGQSELIQRVANLMGNKPSVLVCMEANPDCCHRTRLACAVSEKTDLPIFDLGAGKNGKAA